MAWSKNNDVTNTNTGSPVTVSLTNSTIVGSLIVVGVISIQTNTFNVPTDTAGNTYVDCGVGQLLFNGSAYVIQLFYTINTAAISNTVSVSQVGNSASFMRIVVEEWTGNALSNPVDVTSNSGSNASTGTGGGQNVTTGLATTNFADLVIGFCDVVGGTLTTGTGFTTAASDIMESLIQTVAGSVAATWSDNTNSDSYTAIMAAFKAFGSGGVTFSNASVIGTDFHWLGGDE
jgi:hypothetical protein